MYGERVKTARQAKGWTCEYLAFECEINTRTLSRIERGVTQASVETQRKLVYVLGEI